jgi:hypothetical protein
MTSLRFNVTAHILYRTGLGIEFKPGLDHLTYRKYSLPPEPVFPSCLIDRPVIYRSVVRPGSVASAEAALGIDRPVQSLKSLSIYGYL